MSFTLVAIAVETKSSQPAESDVQLVHGQRSMPVTFTKGNKQNPWTVGGIKLHVAVLSLFFKWC